ncbi:MAG: hypothetical protein H0W68_06380 [Gemmatimonadaceae bacterium]|nr:hypothetical protein [Gemmatimonadaceae bacterium]
MSGSITTDTIDLADVGRSVRRGWHFVAGAMAIGAIIALAIILFGPRRFDGVATAVVRTAPDPGSSLLAKVGDAAGGAAALLGGGASTPIETELQILSSRAVASAVVDSLHLQVEPRAPSRAAAVQFVRAVTLVGGFKPTDVTFRRVSPASFRVSGPGIDAATSGSTVRLPIGTLVLADALPPTFTLRLFDRDDALLRFTSNLTVVKAGGEVVRVSYRAADSVTAAAVPNALLATYLARRHTTDRGNTEHRVEFLSAQLDSTAMQLAAAERALREFQERSGVIDPLVIGKIALERNAELRKDIGALEVERGALQQLLGQIASGRMSARQLAAYPTFLKSAGINELLKQLSELETERNKLLDRRLETDDEVVALSNSITNVEGQLVPLGKAYSSALDRQRADLGTQLGTMTTALGAFPGAAQSATRLGRDVLRLSAIFGALQGQLVQARLSAIAEGGDVRALDVATPPKRVAFPEPVLTASVGLGAGLLAGLLLAVLAGSHGRYLEDPYAIERAVGVPVLRLDPRTPLLMAGRQAVRTVLLVPVPEGVGTRGVAERLVDTALARGESATVLDLTSTAAISPQGDSVGAMIARLEAAHGLVFVRLPGLAAESTAALLSEARPVLLVAPGKRVDRRELTSAMSTLRRLDVPCAGVVLTEVDERAVTSGRG